MLVPDLPELTRGRPIQLLSADPKNVLYIGNIPKHIGEDQLRKELVSLCGTDIRKVDLCRDTEGRSKGFGWATFVSHSDAEDAVKVLHQKNFHDLTMIAAFAEKKSAEKNAFVLIFLLSVLFIIYYLIDSKKNKNKKQQQQQERRNKGRLR